MMRRIDKFTYKVPYRHDVGVCTLHVLKPRKGKAVVFVQHRRGNRSLSHTNAIEYVAPQICKKLKIDPKQLALIDGPGRFRRPGSEESDWDFVTFAHRRGDKWGKPKWTRLAIKEWLELFERTAGTLR